VKPVEKLRFSALVESVRRQLAGRKNVVVAGMETHVCVFQTVRDLVDAGLRPVVCVDAVLFDLLGEGGTPEFKRIWAAVR
jgi:nicotinamidase-related amidase